jgi:hypothetical protein
MLGDVATDDVFPGVASVGFSVTQTGYMELPGIAPTAGENLADPDWLTSNTYWGSLAFGYQFPVGSFVPEAGGMRLNWNLSPSQAGNGYQLGAINGPVNLDPILEVGKRYRFTFRCVLASGSTQVRASIGFVGSGSWVTVTDVPVDVSVDYTWTAGKWVGLESGPNPVGSVLVQSISIKERLT